MDAFRRKKYRAEAALWAGQGKRSMSIDPAHLLLLLDEYRPPPPPSEMDRRMEALRTELVATQAKLRVESERSRSSFENGRATAVREHAEEIRRLRASAAQARTRQAPRN